MSTKDSDPGVGYSSLHKARGKRAEWQGTRYWASKLRRENSGPIEQLPGMVATKQQESFLIALVSLKCFRHTSTTAEIAAKFEYLLTALDGTYGKLLDILPL